MEIIRHKDSKYFKKNDKCEIFEYPLKNKDFGIAIVNISGVYPEYGYCINEVCKEIIFVIEGNGKLHFSDSVFDFEKGDVLFIDKGEKYKWDANCKASISSLPAWNDNQYSIVID